MASTSSSEVFKYLSVTDDDAQKIIAAHRRDVNQPLRVSSLEVLDRSYRFVVTNVKLQYFSLEISHTCASRSPRMKSYRVQLSSDSVAPTSYLLVVSLPPTKTSDYSLNALATIKDLYTKIVSQTSIPLPQYHELDTRMTLVPFQYILFSSPPADGIVLSDARKSNRLSDKANARIDLQLGLYLRQLHAIQNDWFGLPTADGRDPVDPSYSWQESITLFLESILMELESLTASKEGLDLPFEDIRKALSRAIGFFLFDDVEVPSLTGYTISEENILITIPPGSEDEPQVVMFPLPIRALWGDPMMETLFIPPGPSKALLEAYKDGGGPLFIFPRQRTKRLWYTFFLAGTVLVEASAQQNRDEEMVAWAKEVLQECTQKLKDAPCY